MLSATAERQGLASAVRRLMRARGMTPAALARAHDLAPYNSSILYRILRGTSGPRLSYLIALCHALAVDPTDLLRRAGLWPASPLPQPQDALDVALMFLERRIGRWPARDRARVLRALQALAVGHEEEAP